MTEDEKKKIDKGSETPVSDIGEDTIPPVDIPDEPEDVEAATVEEETEMGKRPHILKKKILQKVHKDRKDEGEWTPRTKLGSMVKGGQIRTMTEALNCSLPLREPQIVDTLMGDTLVDEVLKVNMVQRMTDSGRRT
ncbi:MAG: hypothetical protein JW939_02500, partial [Candidatus Thermoplasmatota archaeon]|nr:hypothetical protein [Candidatus Thermoplasmatota archaeon]